MAVSADDSPPISLLNLDLTSVVALKSDNFTPISRTPWAGSELARGIKRHQATAQDQKIGESWELSCDPEAPSKILSIPEATLADLISCRTSECLSGSIVASGRTSCDILVKLINPDKPLSLQIHPSDDNKFLKPNECGKPESWLVLSARAGAGIYLGFNKPLTVSDVRKKLENGTFNSSFLQFIPVSAGDFFEIEPHVPHAIGPGIVLLEPQRIVSGKSGKTWRLWDWDRKYDSSGNEDPAMGQPRQLHIAEATSLLDPENQHGLAYASKLKRHPSIFNPAVGITVTVFPANNWYQVLLVRMEPHSAVKLNEKACFAGCIILEGSVHSSNQFTRRTTLMKTGENYFIPAAALPQHFRTKDEPSVLAMIIPSGQGVPPHGGLVFQ